MKYLLLRFWPLHIRGCWLPFLVMKNKGSAPYGRRWWIKVKHLWHGNSKDLLRFYPCGLSRLGTHMRGKSYVSFDGSNVMPVDSNKEAHTSSRLWKTPSPGDVLRSLTRKFIYLVHGMEFIRRLTQCRMEPNWKHIFYAICCGLCAKLVQFKMYNKFVITFWTLFYVLEQVRSKTWKICWSKYIRSLKLVKDLSKCDLSSTPVL